MKNLIESINKKFSAAPSVAPATEPAEPEAASAPSPGDECPLCGAGRWWRQRGGDLWRCDECEPPAVSSLVAERVNDDPVVVETVAVSIGRPWCDRCGSWKGAETSWSDGRVELRCWSCKDELVDDW